MLLVPRAEVAVAVTRSGDATSPEALVSALYDVISGPADQARDWDRFRALFEPGVRFLICRGDVDEGQPARGEWDIEEFVEAASAEYAKDGFWEREVHSRTEAFGGIAHVWSTYESRVGSPDSPPAARGINSVQCVRHDDRLWIAHLVFDFEDAGTPIPARYLTEGSG